MKKRTIGLLLAFISAFSFGIAPLFTKITFNGGSNGIMTMILRNFFSLPFLLIFILYFKISLKITKKQLFQLILLNIIGTSMTGCLLYSSYSYIGIGLASCLHFTYPILIMLSCLIIFKEKPTPAKIIALVLSIMGIAFSVDLSSFSYLGFAMSLLSGFTYAFYVLYLDKTGLKHHNVVVITFYSCLINSITIFIYSLFNNSFTLNITPVAWYSAVGVAILSSIIGIAFLQISLQYIDAPTASIMCTMEPVTSVFLGILILSEPITVLKLISCILIIFAVLIIALDSRRGYIGNMEDV